MRSWLAKDARAHWSELIDRALRGEPQRVTRRGKGAVIFVREDEWLKLSEDADQKPSGRAPERTNIADGIAAITDPIGGVDFDAGLAGKRILLVIGGGIAAYKSLDLIRRLRERGAGVRCILTKGAQQFVTPLAAASLAGSRAHTDLFDREDEADIGHIRLARDADAIVVAPATANLMAKIACGHADDLASTVLLATTLPILIAPAMNVRMWLHPATQRNLATLTRDGVAVVGPERRRHGRGRARPRPHGRAARDRGGAREAPRRRREARGAPARRQARARHLRADARADRSGALHRQPLLRHARVMPSRRRRRRRAPR